MSIRSGSRTASDVLPQEVEDRFARLREARGPGVPDLTRRIRRVAVLASSSRGGSSLVAELLRHCPSLAHLTAEINPILRFFGLNHPSSGTGCDELDARHLTDLLPDRRAALEREIALDVGKPAEHPDPARFGLDVAWRFAVQWPDLDVDPATVAGLAERLADGRRWDVAEDVDRFYVDVLEAVAARGAPVDPFAHDVAEEAVREWRPGTPSRPSVGSTLLEEPPFVVPRPWRALRPDEVETTPLVIKTPSNVYRLPFLEALFPNAEIQVVHLRRNPAAAINGLIDGWRSAHFQSHEVSEPLDIAGYTELHPQNRWFWKFDLAPGWDTLTGADLATVAAHQWRTSHEAVLDATATGRYPATTLWFEDVISGPACRERAFAALCDWLGVPFTGTFQQVVRRGLRPVVATAAPRPGRWRARAEQIGAAIDPAVARTAERLGYGRRRDWI